MLLKGCFIGFSFLGLVGLFETKVAEDHLAASKEVEKIIKTSDFEILKQIVNSWTLRPKKAQKYIIFYLIKDLDSTKELKLENYADLIIWSRVMKGKMPFYGHGYIIKQDIFIESGRRAWAIGNLLKIQLPSFTENMRREELDKAVRESCLRIIEAMNIP